MSTLLDALGYVGEALDKPGRAVRGLLGGRPGEALAAVPFSDSLGLTVRSNAVSGKELVGTDSDILGALVDTVTNPLTFAGTGVGARALSGLRAAPEAAAVAPRAGGLTHFTSRAGAEGIAKDGAVRGRQGVFALPDTAAGQSPLVRGARAGVTPSSMEVPVQLPAAANEAFERVLPLGPYSAWKALGGVRMAPPGAIDTATGAFSPAGSIWGSRAWMYGPDAAMYASIPGAALYNNLTG
jgi:hypothetical protein